MTATGSFLARAVSDEDDRLTAADEPLAGLQRRCGGDLPGIIAVPSILEVVRKSRRYGLKLARTISANDGENVINAWVEAAPRGDGAAGCDILVRNWHAEPLVPEDPAIRETRRRDIDRALAELTVRLDAMQRVLTVDADASDLGELAEAMASGIGQPWTDFVDIDGSDHRQPLHWRLLDGARLSVPGSTRPWQATLVPLEGPAGIPVGFELLLTSDVALPRPMSLAEIADSSKTVLRPGIVGRDVAPVLRQPIARIVANAETIRTRLAGPLAEEYAAYAADISAAGQHLLGLLDDLSDLEVVEAENFDTAADHIDLADVARQAAGILSVRARERGIAIDAPKPGESLRAIAEFRRVLQILLNLIGNAVRYSPPDSQVWIRLEGTGDRARIIVADQGPGMSDAEQARAFEKFERLGRSGDGGSGLGLYISRRLARAMDGELFVESAPGQGARFTLDLPADAEPALTGIPEGGATIVSKLPSIPEPARDEGLDDCGEEA